MPFIRELTHEDDFTRVGQVYVDSWRSAYQGMVPQGYLDKLTPDRWLASLAAEPEASLGLFVEGALIGTSYVCFARDTEREGYGEIVSLYLMPDYVGKGYGRQLMEAALQKLQKDGCEDVCLWALTQNRRAEGFYTHMGFALSGRVQTETIGGKELLLVEYCRSIRPQP